MRNRLIVGATLALLGACSGSSQQVERASATTTGNVPPQPLAEAPGPPTLVLQGVNLPSLTQSMRDRWQNLVANEDGTLVAAFGPELVLLDGTDGSVRGRFPHCAIAAAFHRDEVIVVGCPTVPVEPGNEHKLSPESTVYLWNLTEDSVSTLATGPFQSLSMTAGSRIGLRGLQRAIIVDPATGKTEATFATSDANEEILALGGDRALLQTQTGKTVLDAKGTRTSVVGSGDLTPELAHVYELDYRTGRLNVTNLDGSGRVETLIAGTSKVLGFDQKGERSALELENGERHTVQLLDAARRPLCTHELPSSHSLTNDFAWSADGETLAFALQRREAANGDAAETIVTLRAADCTVLYRSPEYRNDSWAEVEFNSSLVAVTASNIGRQGQTMHLVRPSKQSTVSLPITPLPTLVSWSQTDLLVEDAERQSRFDPVSELVTDRSLPPPIRLGGATLSVTLADGTVEAIRGRIPSGAQGPILLVDQAGKRTPLIKSEAFAKVLEAARPMSGDCGEQDGFVWCNRTADKEGHFVALWDASGKRLLERNGLGVRLSADGKRALVDNYPSGYNQLLELPSGRVLRTSELQMQAHASFDPTRSLVAWDSIGMVDSATNKILWEAGVFGDWIRGTSLISAVRVNVGARRYDGRGGFGPLDLRDARTGKVVHSFDVDSAITAQSQDGKIVLTRDTLDGWRVRETTKWTQLVHAGTRNFAQLSHDGGFVWTQGSAELEAIRNRGWKQIVPGALVR